MGRDHDRGRFSKIGRRSKAPENLKFEREDWSLYRTVEGLQQKAGVPAKLLRRLVLKELADNGLDLDAHVNVGELPGGGYFVEDDGSGIGTPEETARLFSVNRPMLSAKLLRLPTRGALGNGLRVVAGAVLASGKGSSLTVITHDRRIVLRPERDGSTTVVSAKSVKHPVGTRIEIALGPSIPSDALALSWAREACQLAGRGQSYVGKSSPHWYDAAQFHELLYASGDRPVRELVATLDGCTGGMAGEIVAEAGLGRALCNAVTHVQAAKLLKVARSHAREVNPRRLGAVGTEAFPGYAYGYSDGVAQFGSAEPQAEIPFVVEVWAKARTADTILSACVNRTPITGQIEAARDKRDIDAFGCGLAYTIAQAPKDAQFDIRLNVTTPYMPITSDGKEPNLEPFLDEIRDAAAKAVRKAHRPNAGNKQSQKDIVLERLDEAVASASGEGEYRFNERQIFYQLRPIVLEETGQPLQIGNFKNILTDYENEHGEIPGMYREPRGSIYHPHRGETITLGTLMVEAYQRPSWTFNKLVYIEKEGFSEALKDVRWAERHDCMLMSSKGFTTRAARDLVDKLAEHNEPVTIFCVHDADAYGTMIYQTFQEATRARRARKIKIVNLGLEPWEAVAARLGVEDVEADDKRKPVAGYVQQRRDGDYWEGWLQTHRVELNAMTTPEFIAWLDGKMAKHGNGKLVPPHEVLTAELDRLIKDRVRADIRERILREAHFEDRVAKAVAAIETPNGAALAKSVKRLFKQKPEREWRDAICAVLDRISEDER
jgi:hypothetical protein